jgi:predicted ATP-grasp superfamily ATP-dependent carboligase
MLAAVLSDFKKLPGLYITTIIHSSCRNLMTQFIDDRIHVSWAGEGTEKCCAQDLYERVVAECDAVLVIAPETGGLLAKLIGIAEKKGKAVFGPTAKAAALVSNKGETTKLLASHGLPVPRSEILSLPLHSLEKVTDHFSWPLVLKPVTGAGGQGVKVINNLDELERAVKQYEEALDINACPRAEFRSIQVQDYIPGDYVSVSCFVSACRARPISLNLQHIAHGKELYFQGITIPYLHPQSMNVLDTAKRACELIEGLAGFVGVDLVLGPQGPVLIEINPRISVAYVALREVIAGNLAGDLWLTCIEKRLPPKPEFIKTYTYRLDN